MSFSERRWVGGWLLGVWLMVLLMVMIGGTTRLTGSGLSIVEWAPIRGILPPLSDAEWHEAFDAYQRTPQFERENHWMSLADFQRIYFWEYVHRLWGRLIGFAFALPWLYFVVRKVLRGRWLWRTLLLLVLGGLQGALGWYMVKSGLVNEPRVSHYRLAAHLLLGVGVGQLVLWQALELANPRDPRHAISPGPRRYLLAALPLLAIQIVYGALMAGTGAGHVAATFPDMNGHYGPASFFIGDDLRRNLLDNPFSIHWLHRALALLVLLHASTALVITRRGSIELRAASYVYLAAVAGQVALGALTVVLRLPIPVAVAHQGGAYIVFSAAVLLAHAALGARAPMRPAAAREPTDADGGASTGTEAHA